jgi:CubicO group peptidase (beta-lactamase class C family)
LKKTLFILLAAAVLPSYAQTRQDTIHQIEKVFSRYLAENPGCQFAFSKNGEVVFSKAWGSLDLEHNTPFTTVTVVEAGSVAKQFTAAAILLLEQQQKLSLNDDVRKYIPELRDYGTVITLKHLMHQTSGVKDWEAIVDLTNSATLTKIYNNQDALTIIADQKTLNNIPGSEYIYSNSNFILLATIVERTSGMRFPEFIEKNIFTPAGMTHSEWRDNLKRVVKNRATAYQKKDIGYESDMPFLNTYGDGGLLTTAEDLLKWNAFYLSGKFGSPSLKDKQTATDRFNNGLTNYYGAGLLIQTNRGLKVIRHTGGSGGYRAYLGYYPDLDLSIAWLSNTSEFDEEDAVDEVMSIFVKNQPPKANKTQKIVNVSAKTLKGYEGWYRNERTAYGTQIIVKNNQLLAVNRDNEMPLTAISENEFKIGGEKLVFDKKSKAYQFINSDQEVINYTFVPPANLVLNDFQGRYYSDETKSELSISQEGDFLMLVFNRYTAYRLKPTYPDAFRLLDFGGIVNFERDENGKVSKMKIGQGRARNVEFARIE